MSIDISIIWVRSKFCHKRDWWQQAHLCLIHSITQLFSHMIEASKLSDWGYLKFQCYCWMVHQLWICYATELKFDFGVTEKFYLQPTTTVWRYRDKSWTSKTSLPRLQKTGCQITPCYGVWWLPKIDTHQMCNYNTCTIWRFYEHEGRWPAVAMSHLQIFWWNYWPTNNQWSHSYIPWPTIIQYLTIKVRWSHSDEC